MKILQTSSTFSSLSADRDVFTVYMFTSWARADSSGHWQPPAVHQSGHYWDVLLGVLCPGLEPCNWGGSGDGDDKQDVVTYLAVIRTKQTDKPTSLIQFTHIVHHGIDGGRETKLSVFLAYLQVSTVSSTGHWR